MSNNAECWGKDIRECAKIVAVIGIVGSILSFNILGLIIYILVYMGVENQKPSYLLPAKICLIIGLALSAIFVILFITLAVLGDSQGHHPSPRPDPQHSYSPALLVLASIPFLLSTAYLIFSYVVVDKARNYLLENYSVPQI